MNMKCFALNDIKRKKRSLEWIVMAIIHWVWGQNPGIFWFSDSSIRD